MGLSEILILVVVVVVVAAVGLLFFFTSATFPVTALKEKPALSEEIIKNPDIIYPAGTFGWLADTPENRMAPPVFQGNSLYPVLNESVWKGNGFVDFNYGLGGRRGVAVIYPVNSTVGRYIEQTVHLTGKNEYILHIGITDAADFLRPDINTTYTGNCADVGVKVLMNDISKNRNYTVFNKIVRQDKWYDFSVSLGKTFSGDDVKVTVLSYDADGGCGSSNAEWAAVDYVDIAKV